PDRAATGADAVVSQAAGFHELVDGGGAELETLGDVADGQELELGGVHSGETCQGHGAASCSPGSSRNVHQSTFSAVCGNGHWSGCPSGNIEPVSGSTACGKRSGQAVIPHAGSAAVHPG